MIEKLIDNYHLFIFKDKSELSIKVSDYISERIKINLNAKDRFQFCVCGGSTPKNVYSFLSKKELNWAKVDIFLGDERCVNPNSDDSNTLIADANTTRAPIHRQQIAGMNSLGSVPSAKQLSGYQHPYSRMLGAIRRR